MQESCLQLMSQQDYQRFKNHFDDKKQAKDLISFSDFSSIVKSSSFFDQNRVSPYLDSIKKELKTKINTESDSGIMLNESDYFKYIKNVWEQKRYKYRHRFALIQAGFRSNLKYLIEKILNL